MRKNIYERSAQGKTYQVEVGEGALLRLIIYPKRDRRLSEDGQLANAKPIPPESILEFDQIEAKEFIKFMSDFAGVSIKLPWEN